MPFCGFKGRDVIAIYEMMDYNFEILQPSEFECFSRDLLQAREDMFIESFADGRDKGIDFRFTYSRDKTCIIQCKRYKDWKELKRRLKEEVGKVTKLAPKRYILTTSVDLSVAQKEEIKNLFNPYIVASSDILGRKDLNNLLEQHHEIEKNYHKLWLSSTNILNIIINRATLNWSSFELEKIKNDIRLYVENKSLGKALAILKEHRYVVISGIPGIGKTTLARMIVYTMLAKDYEEFVYITDDMDNAAKMYDKEKKQIFFFDDFLGSNSFIPQSVSFENKLITFIEKVRSSKNKLFILSTREYVLSEAKEYYEKLSMNNIDIAKCTIELDYYTKSIKAKILYNHLAEANIPKQYIDAFLDMHSYREIINHQNFNPRVIESIIKEQIWNVIAPDEFASKIKGFFDNPVSVWQFAFEKLDKETRYALLILGTMTMGNYVRLEDFEEAYRTFCTLTHDEIGMKFDDVKWKYSLKVLLNCFIKIRSSKKNKLVSVYNPSITDFIIWYLGSNRNTMRLILIGSCFVEQVINIFTDDQKYADKKNLAFVDSSLIYILESSFSRMWNEGKSCQLKEMFWNNAEREGFTETRILVDFKTKYPTYCKVHKGFIEELYNTDELTWESVKFTYRVMMIDQLDWTRFPTKADEYIMHIVEEETLDTDKWILLADTIKELDLYKDVVDEAFYDKLDEDLKTEINRFTYLGECEEQRNKLDSLIELLPEWQWAYASLLIDDVEKRIKENEDSEDYDDYYDGWREQNEKEDSQIDEMFSALRVYD